MASEWPWPGLFVSQGSESVVLRRPGWLLGAQGEVGGGRAVVCHRGPKTIRGNKRKAT